MENHSCFINNKDDLKKEILNILKDNEILFGNEKKWSDITLLAVFYTFLILYFDLLPNYSTFLIFFCIMCLIIITMFPVVIVPIFIMLFVLNIFVVRE